MLAYGLAADSVNEYVRIGESTAIKCLEKFTESIISIFGEQYLRSPNSDDLARLLEVGEHQGFPSMLGNVDCIHWYWKNCPTTWRGQFTGYSHSPTIILEAVASYNLWIWHAFFGLPGSLNDISVQDKSSLFYDLANDHAPPVNYSINERDHLMGYYLADGIYPLWATFVKTIPNLQYANNKHFATKQETIRKDVERAFGVLQTRFAIVREPSHFFKQ